MGNPTLFLDRDGTINVDRGYINSPDSLELIVGAAEAVIRAKKAGFKLAIITNQAGVAKGITPRDAIPRIHERLEELIRIATAEKDFKFDDVKVCMHHPDEFCPCRKPETQMLEESVSKLDSDLSRSFFVGDKMSDLSCGYRVGVKPILVLSGHGMEAQAELGQSDLKSKTLVVEDLKKAVDWILKNHK